MSLKLFLKDILGITATEKAHAKYLQEVALTDAFIKAVYCRHFALQAQEQMELADSIMMVGNVLTWDKKFDPKNISDEFFERAEALLPIVKDKMVVRQEISKLSAALTM